MGECTANAGFGGTPRDGDGKDGNGQKKGVVKKGAVKKGAVKKGVVKKGVVKKGMVKKGMVKKGRRIANEKSPAQIPGFRVCEPGNAGCDLVYEGDALEDGYSGLFVHGCDSGLD